MSAYEEERATRLRRTTAMLGPFALRYREFAASVHADLEQLNDDELREAKTLGYRAFHDDPADMPSEVMEVGRVVEVEASVVLAVRQYGSGRGGRGHEHIATSGASRSPAGAARGIAPGRDHRSQAR